MSFPQREDFKIIGAYAGMSIAQGGQGLPILADVAFLYFHTGATTNLIVPTEDLPAHVRCVVEQVSMQSDYVVKLMCLHFVHNFT